MSSWHGEVGVTMRRLCTGLFVALLALPKLTLTTKPLRFRLTLLLVSNTLSLALRLPVMLMLALLMTPVVRLTV